MRSSKESVVCLFCRIISKRIPAAIVHESPRVLAFMDIAPLSEGHVLVVPKFCAQKLHEVPAEYLSELLPVAAKIAATLESSDYNILQNNGALAYQSVNHVHLHVIPKRDKDDGLVVRWKTMNATAQKLETLAEGIRKHLGNAADDSTPSQA
eukprot:Opistho-2@82553